MRGSIITSQSEFDAFTEEIGNPHVFNVENPKGELACQLECIDWESRKIWPPDAFIVIARRLYFPPYATRAAKTQFQDNIIEVDFLGRGRDMLPNEKRNFYKIKHFRTMVTSHIKVTGQKKIINCLAKPKYDGNSDYIF